MKNGYQELLEQLQQGVKAVLITLLQQDGIKKIIYRPNMEQQAKISQEDSSRENISTGDASQENSGRENTSQAIAGRIVEEIAGQSLEQGIPLLKKMEDKVIFAEPFAAKERMILFGGGHVSLALAEIGAKIGFSVTVADDRPFFANRTRFPWAEEVICDSFTNSIKKVQITPSDHVVILTRGHRYDGECLRELYRQRESAYLGMIGSRRRVRSLKEQLEEEGLAKEWLERLHSPVGLDIGAVTPEEIAISILAEIIQEKRKPREGKRLILQSDIDMRVMDELACPPENRSEMRKAIVTIVDTKGSVPRKAGAKMIVYENGFLSGTIGGGCAESGVMGKAREIIGTGGYQICEIDMTGTIAEEEGMVCGGIMKVLIEDDKML